MAVRVKTVLTDPRNDVLGVAGGDVRCGPSLNVDEAGGGSCIQCGFPPSITQQTDHFAHLCAGDLPVRLVETIRLFADDIQRDTDVYRLGVLNLILVGKCCAGSYGTKHEQ